ncbi:MAG: GGDEF domain-containing response regulator [Acidiferrobacterales bacterium]
MNEIFDNRPDNEKSILLVEDSATTAAMISKFLSESYVLVQTKDGADAWEVLQNNHEIGLVITDLNMPNMTGHQLLVEIRRSDDPRINSLPVIVMTATDDKVDRNLSFLNGANDFVTKPIDEMELVARVNVHYRLANTIRKLEESQKALAVQATTDPLTGLRNRRSFFEKAEELVNLHRRYKSELSILMIDIDHFKKINDSLGHDGGDVVLKRFADILISMVREVDIVGRLGGEEFAILLPDTKRLGAAVLAERTRAAIQRTPISYQGQDYSITASIGIASISSEAAGSVSEFIRIADSRLYLAKKAGRNRICVDDEGNTSFG